MPQTLVMVPRKLKLKSYWKHHLYWRDFTVPEGAGKIYQHSYVPVTPMHYNNNLPEKMSPLVN